VKHFVEKRLSPGSLIEEDKSGLGDEVSVLALPARHLD
jgi:hypothetical protein